MRRLHERGHDGRGLVVDGEGAMLGPDCVLVHRTPAGFRCLSPDEAAIIQTAILGRVASRVGCSRRPAGLPMRLRRARSRWPRSTG
ncbi:MAG: hypothetical protein AB7H90_11375 [Alphaproteobacteria bacterium]